MYTISKTVELRAGKIELTATFEPLSLSNEDKEFLLTILNQFDRVIFMETKAFIASYGESRGKTS